MGENWIPLSSGREDSSEMKDLVDVVEAIETVDEIGPGNTLCVKMRKKTCGFRSGLTKIYPYQFVIRARSQISRKTAAYLA